MSLSIGIAGSSRAGKSTLISTLAKAQEVAADYPFATIESNVGVVDVADLQLAVLAKLYG